MERNDGTHADSFADTSEYPGAQSDPLARTRQEALTDLILAVAIMAGLIGGICFNNLTAWPLLGSLFFCLVLREWQVPFEFWLWFKIDLLAILFILRRNMPYRDWIILALFGLAWVSYLLPDPMRNWGSSAVVITQLLLTIPLIKNQGTGWTVSHGPIREVKYEGLR